MAINGIPKVGAGTSPYVLLNTYEAYWKLDETTQPWNDLRGLRPLVGVPQPDPGTGIINGAVDFDIASSHVLGTNGPLISAFVNDWTISFWWNQETRPGASLLVGMDFGTPPLRGWWIRMSGAGNIQIQVSDDGTSITPFQIVTGPVPLLTWQHLIVRYRLGVGFDGFFNGAPVTPAPWTLGINNPFVPFLVGNQFTSLFFDGLMDEIGFWRHALPDIECSLLYNGGAGRTAPFS